MIDLIYDIRHRLLCKFGDSLDGSQLHFFINGFCVDIECTTENIGKTDDIVDLIGVITPSRAHQYVRTARNRVFIRNFRNGIG